MSYLDGVKSFADVPITDKGVDTVEFLKASEGLVGMFDLFGSKAFGVVQSDITGNIKKVRERYTAHPTTSATLEELVVSEQGEKKKVATEGLMWLLRGLKFTRLGLQNSYDKPDQELSASFTESYQGTLKKFHSFVVKPVFTLAMNACPYRKDFYQKLSAGGTEAETNEKLGKWLSALKGITDRMDTFYEKGGHGTV